jgi:hypothetical protein
MNFCRFCGQSMAPSPPCANIPETTPRCTITVEGGEVYRMIKGTMTPWIVIIASIVGGALLFFWGIASDAGVPALIGFFFMLLFPIGYGVFIVLSQARQSRLAPKGHNRGSLEASTTGHGVKGSSLQTSSIGFWALRIIGTIGFLLITLHMFKIPLKDGLLSLFSLGGGIGHLVGMHQEFGQAQGNYEEVQARMLSAHKFNYIDKKVKVTFEFDMLDIQSNYSRMDLVPYSIGDYAAQGIDILVDEQSPLYNDIVKLNPGDGQMFSVYGTVHMYNNTMDSVYITPDKIVFH